MPREVTIARARLETELDPLTARLRLEPQLANAELRPSGLPPSAVLCVRRIADPLPGRLTLDSTQARPPPEWERAFVDALTVLLRSAARPAHEAVPANAEAVLFADRAELLACLARDARDGVAWTRWWWRNLSPLPAPGVDPVVAAWLAAPEHVPAALALLAARHEATPFVAALPLAVAGQLAGRVAAVFGAIALERVVAEAVRPSVTTAAHVDPPRSRDGQTPVRDVAPPWETIAPEARAQPLAPARALLLGVALSLRRAPAIARTKAFAEAAAAWLNAPQTATASTGSARGAPIRHDPLSLAARAASRPLQRDASSEEQSEAALPSPGASALPHPRAPGRPSRTAPSFRESRVESSGEVDAPSVQEQELEQATVGAPLAAAPENVALTKQDAATPKSARPSRRRDAPLPALETKLPPVPVEPEADDPAIEDDPWDAPALGIETELGGLLYLLNLFLYLGLYGDFTQPLERGLGLDPWRCVALIGRRLVSGARDDPVWRMLDRLGGPSEFRPPRAWRVSRPWLEPFDNAGVWRWSMAGGTLRVEHPAGFPAIAVPRTTGDQLGRELRRLGVSPTLRRTTLRREPADPLARWSARLAAYANARLRVALGEDDVENLLFRKRARVFVTPTHVDVVLSLAELPLEVRFAGLDRTPGWIPAAGRFVSFHFE
jgi:hypothetical protein